MEKRGNQERKLLQATPKDQYFQTYRSLESEFNADDFANNMIRKYENEIRALVHTLR